MTVGFLLLRSNFKLVRNTVKLRSFSKEWWPLPPVLVQLKICTIFKKHFEGDAIKYSVVFTLEQSLYIEMIFKCSA